MKRFPISLAVLMLIGVIFPFNEVSGQNSLRIQNILNRVSADSLIMTIAELTGKVPVLIAGQTDTILSRQYNNQGNEKAFQYLKGRLQRYGLSVDSQVFSATGKNLFARIKGADQTIPAVIVCGHYDNVGVQRSQGADDNASGVAAVLECARLCRDEVFSSDVVFAFWDEEETGLIGSQAYVKTLLSGANPPGAVLNLDMIGWDGDGDSLADIHVRPIGDSPAWATKAMKANADYQIGLNLRVVNPGLAVSDHAAFWNENMTAIGITEDYSGDFNPYWHTAGDSIGNLNMPYLRKMTRLTLATLLSHALALPSGVPAIASTGAVHVYPNPFHHSLQVSGSILDAGTIFLFDVTGRLLMTQKTGQAWFKGTIHADSLPQGHFLLVIKDKAGRIMFTKQLEKR